MLNAKNFFSIAVLLAAVMLAGCYKDQNPVEPLHNSNQADLPKLTIPVGAVVDSAQFFINVTTAQNEEVSLYGVTGMWDESTVTWNNFGAAFNATSEGSFTPDAAGWYSVDVTALVSSWLDSTLANNGILLKEESPAMMQYYSSRETAMAPFLKVYWTFNGGSGYDSTAAMADAFINSAEGDMNYGDSTDLITGWEDTVEVQTLVAFEIEQTPVSMGCTHGFGYWKTHSAYGPAPYDTVWAMLGEDSTFFLSNQSNYMVMWTSPSHGNVYYMLAHQYITTDLNILSGADPTDVQEAFDDATDLFDMYTPEEIGGLHGADSLRHQFISLKNILAQYNEGYIGPGACGSGYSDAPMKRE